MNWYARYPGDYMQDTADLSLTEHGAYALLMDHCYGTERGLPDDPGVWYRICRAFTPSEQEAVRAVVDRFFPIEDGKCHIFLHGKTDGKTDGKRHNKRIAKELAKRMAINDKRSEAGRKGAEAKWSDKHDSSSKNGKCHNNSDGKTDGKKMANATTSTSTSTTIPTNHNQRESGRFQPPSVDEVREYCRQRTNNVSAERFHSFYSSKGWMVGKNKMKDWRAAVRNWEQRESENKATGNIFANLKPEDMQ